MDAVEKERMMDELVRMIINGTPKAECARVLGLHQNTILNWTNEDPVFKLKLARTRAKMDNDAAAMVNARAAEGLSSIEGMIEAATLKALERIVEKLDSKNEHIQLKAAVDLLDRNPKTSKTKKVQTTAIHAIVTPDALAMAARTARELDENYQVGRAIEAVVLSDSDDISSLTPEGSECG